MNQSICEYKSSNDVLLSAYFLFDIFFLSKHIFGNYIKKSMYFISYFIHLLDIKTFKLINFWKNNLAFCLNYLTLSGWIFSGLNILQFLKTLKSKEHFMLIFFKVTLTKFIASLLNVWTCSMVAVSFYNCFWILLVAAKPIWTSFVFSNFFWSSNLVILMFI